MTFFSTNKQLPGYSAWRALLLASVIVFAGCNNPSSDNAENDKLLVAASFTVIADMARNVAGDAATVVSVTKPGAEIHNYSPTPKDIAQTTGAGLVLWNGMGLELWFEKFLNQLGDVPHAVVTEGIEPIDINNGPYTGKPNPHAWMSPTDAHTYVDNIERAMSAADPVNKAIYAKNAAEYKKNIAALIEPVRKILEGFPEEQRWLVTSEGAFSYLARDFDLKELYLWPINADQQGTPSQVRAVIDTIKAENIGVVFSESTVSAKPAQQVARDTDARYGGVLYVDSLSDAKGPVPTYLDLMHVTVVTIVDGLNLASNK